MSKQAVFTMKLEPDLRASFMTAAAEADRPASQIVRELMRGYIDQHRRTRTYAAFLHSKVEAARVSMRRGLGRPDAEVEAAFSV